MHSFLNTPGFIFQLTKRYLQVGESAEICINFCPTFETYRVDPLGPDEEPFPISVEDEIFLEVCHTFTLYNFTSCFLGPAWC